MAAVLSWYQTRMRRASTTPPVNDPNAVTLNMGDLLDQQGPAAAANKPKKHETLFGPSLGTVSSGPAWANQTKASQGDELTPETVKAWVAKSKEPSQPTTTLQALVNLKRPSLRLTPVTSTDPTEDMPTAHHGLEFEYDADAPKCQISVHFVSAAPSTTATLVFETLVDGGFGKALKLDDGALLDLAKLDAQDHKSHNKSMTSLLSPPTDTPGLGPTDTASPSTTTAGTLSPPRTKKRFSAFHFRKKVRASATGPALQVVDDQAPVIHPADGVEAPKAPEVMDEEGVRLTIRLEALDESDHILAAPNSQVTYLHVVRIGQAPANEEEDTRPWVVKVVKREATIGLHTFHLHEIYGLSSATAPAPAPASYPPQTTPVAEDAYDFAGTECVLCLSEAREVVLLPCRHLVACKECAINMIEFGAGGTLTHDEPQQSITEPSAPVPADPLSAAEAGTGPGPSPVEDPIVAPAAPRRKRKAKGWFCPVCRQPYTSLLRITTTAPNVKKEIDDAEEELKEKEAVATPASESTGGWIKPAFLRSLSAKKSSGADSRPGTGGGARPATREGSIVVPQTPVYPRSGEVTPVIPSGRVSPIPTSPTVEQHPTSPTTVRTLDEKSAAKEEHTAVTETKTEPEPAPEAKVEDAAASPSALHESSDASAPGGDSSSKLESHSPPS